MAVKGQIIHDHSLNPIPPAQGAGKFFSYAQLPAVICPPEAQRVSIFQPQHLIKP